MTVSTNERHAASQRRYMARQRGEDVPKLKPGAKKWNVPANKIAPEAFAEHFWANVRRGSASECWQWTGAKFTNGYGTVSVNRKARRAHRVAFELANGPIPAGVVVRHACDNPICVNPAHLLVGTQQDNVDDRQRRNRTARGERSSTAKLTAAQVMAIRADKRGARPVARDYGVARSLVQRIRQMRLWTHV